MIWLFWILAALAVIAGLVVLASYICCRLVYSVDRDRIDPRKPDTNPQYFPSLLPWARWSTSSTLQPYSSASGSPTQKSRRGLPR